MTQTKTLEGKVAVVTGGSRGIGKAVAAALIERGAKVVIGDLLESEGEATVQEFNTKAGTKVAAFTKTDVTKYSDNIALFRLAEKEFAGVDIAFLNAGIGSNANTLFMPLDDELDERMLDVNTTAVVKGTKVAVLHMAKRGGGVIVNTASVAGFLSFQPVGIYAASKHGVIGWTRSFSMLPAICNVRVNAVCPYWVETDLKTNLTNHVDQDPFEALVAQSPRTKIETVVDAVLQLIEDKEANTKTLLALPNGVIRPQEPIPPYEEIITPEYMEAAKQYSTQDGVAYYKNRLAKALATFSVMGNKA